MFITFEGIDFCGKSTQVRLLKEYLEQRGFKVKVLREPGGTELSEKIRTLLLDKANYGMSSETEIFLFSAARAQLVREVIVPLLEAGYVVISDRFFDSTTAYQGYGRGLDLETVEHINRFAVGDAVPDLTFFIDIPQEEGERRKNLDRLIELDRIEVSESRFYTRVRQGFMELAVKYDRFRLVNGLQSIDQIHHEITEIVTESLLNQNTQVHRTS